MTISLEKFNYLLILAEEQNITRAAHRLFITQPTLTGYINKIESELGVRLFDRSRSPIQLTKSGEVYLQKMKALLLSEQELIGELRYHEQPRPRLVIGIGHMHSQLWSAALAETMLTKHPKLDMKFMENKEDVLMDALRDGLIDVFFGSYPTDSFRFVYEEISEEKLSLMIPESLLDIEEEEKKFNSADHPYTVTEAVLKRLPVISPATTQGLYLNFRVLTDRYHIQPSRVIQTANMGAGIQMVARGLGYMYTANELVDLLPPGEQEKIIYCRMDGLAQKRKFYCVYLEANPALPFIQEAAQILRKKIKSGIDYRFL